ILPPPSLSTPFPYTTLFRSSLFRNEIFENIQQNNPEYDKLTLFKKTQKLLDRFLFIFFAEDRLLLPPNSIREISKQWTTLKDLRSEEHTSELQSRENLVCRL